MHHKRSGTRNRMHKNRQKMRDGGTVVGEVRVHARCGSPQLRILVGSKGKKWGLGILT